MNKYLLKLKEKCNLDNSFCDILVNVLDSLEDYGYISFYTKNRLYRKMLENVTNISFGENSTIDFKSGYYDVLQKEVYIKDRKNIKSIVLRMIYSLCTRQGSKDDYIVGFSLNKLSTKNYKLERNGYGLNRAVTSNIVCKILDFDPTLIAVTPSALNYSFNFFDKKVSSTNDIYPLEALLLNELCFVSNVKEEKLENYLFRRTPMKLAKKLFQNKTKNSTSILNLLDSISINFNHYNKLCYLRNLLNDNYLEIKKYSLSKGKTYEKLLKKEQLITTRIFTTLLELYPDIYGNNEIDSEFNAEMGISEQISNLENVVLSEVKEFENVCFNILKNNHAKSDYFSILEKYIEFRKLTIFRNTLLEEEIKITSLKILNIPIDLNNITLEQTDIVRIFLLTYIYSNPLYRNLLDDARFTYLPIFNTSKTNVFLILDVGNTYEVLNVKNLNCNMLNYVLTLDEILTFESSTLGKLRKREANKLNKKKMISVSLLEKEDKKNRFELDFENISNLSNELKENMTYDNTYVYLLSNNCTLYVIIYDFNRQYILRNASGYIILAPDNTFYLDKTKGMIK